MNFLDLQMGDHIPDAKTIWDFTDYGLLNG